MSKNLGLAIHALPDSYMGIKGRVPGNSTSREKKITKRRMLNLT